MVILLMANILMTILLTVIDVYSIREYWCLLMVIILLTINGYSIGGYWFLLMAIILMFIVLVVIDCYSINGN
jgi:hypothetical protein